MTLKWQYSGQQAVPPGRKMQSPGRSVAHVQGIPAASGYRIKSTASGSTREKPDPFTVWETNNFWHTAMSYAHNTCYDSWSTTEQRSWKWSDKSVKEFLFENGTESLIQPQAIQYALALYFHSFRAIMPSLWSLNMYPLSLWCTHESKKQFLSKDS